MRTRRTLRQMRGLRPGDVFLVKNYAQMMHAQEMCREHNLEGIRVMSVSGGLDRLRGTRYDVWIEVDHDVDLGPRDQEIVRLHNSRYTGEKREARDA